METGYKILDHPADIGIEAFGKNLKSAFEQSAIGLVSIILDTSRIQCDEQKHISIFGEDYEQLLVKWLSEVLYIFDAEKFVPINFLIEKLTPKYLSAFVSGEKFKNNIHATYLDVKAVTYHQISIEETNTGAKLRVFLDI